MRIWVDADACPGAIKDVLCAAAERVGVELVFVANRPLYTRPSRWVRSTQVGSGFDVADAYIVEQLEAGDLVITADVPLAAAAIAKGACALGSRGLEYTRDNIGEYLDTRNFLSDLRGAGETTGGPPPLGPREVRAFANALDRFLARARGPLRPPPGARD
jgi:uncharacterized protein YaiI (UPF0178 family)